MSDLIYQNYSNKCKGWVNPSNLFFGPEIISLTGYQSPAGSNTVVSIVGANFFSYSVVHFGTFTPTVYFINSTLISFYVPNTLTSGTYPVKVCNGSICSNIVNYTIDMSSGYWMINNGGNTNTISNTNPNGVQVSWLSRGAPVTIDATTYYDSSHSYSVPNNVNWIICDFNTIPSNNIYINLPTNSNFIGREIMFKAIGPSSSSPTTWGDVNSTSPNILNIANNITSVILDPGQRVWCTLVFDGSSWVIMQQGS